MALASTKLAFLPCRSTVSRAWASCAPLKSMPTTCPSGPTSSASRAVTMPTPQPRSATRIPAPQARFEEHAAGAGSVQAVQDVQAVIGRLAGGERVRRGGVAGRSLRHRVSLVGRSVPRSLAGLVFPVKTTARPRQSGQKISRRAGGRGAGPTTAAGSASRRTSCSTTAGRLTQRRRAGPMGCNGSTSGNNRRCAR